MDDLAPRAPQRRRGLAAGLALASVAAAGAGGWFALGRPRAAPEVAFTTLQGRRIALDALRGKAVLVNFWATSCAICMAEMPALVRLHAELGPHGLETIAVAMPYDRPDFVLEYARRAALPFPVALDPMGAVSGALGPVRGTPTRLLIDRRGRIARTLEGEADFAALARLVERTLADA